MNPDVGALGELLPVLLKEARRNLLALASAFAIISLAALPIILLIPKHWESSTLLLIKASNILPLVSNQHEEVNVADEIALLKQTMSSRRILREVLAFDGLAPGKQSPREEQKALDKLKARIRIKNPEPELVRISYTDTDPQLSYRITKKLAEIYIREGRAATQQQSRDAFEFIDKQATEYSAKLLDAHEKLLAYYHEHQREPAASAGKPSAPAVRIATASKPRAEPLPASGKVAAEPPESRQAEEQLKARVAQLQSDRDRLLGIYTNEHPEVIRVTRSLTLVRDELRHAEQARMDREKASLDAALAGESEVHPSYTPVAHVAPGVQSRAVPIGTAEPAPDPDLRGVSQDTNLAELRRRYEAMRDVYQDLLKRREAAHVSMDLDNDDRGLSIRIQEPPEVPVTAAGLRLSQLSLAGLVMAVALPVGVLFAMLRFDGRLRIAQEIERTAKVPLLVSIPAVRGPEERGRDRRRTLLAALLVMCVFAAYATTFVVRLTHSS